MMIIVRFLRLAASACCLAAALSAGMAVAEIKIEVTGVDADVKRNVLALLSIARYADRQRIEADAVERLYRRVDEEVRGALKPFGYYQPTITSTAPLQDKDRDWHLKIAIEPGPAVLVEEVSVIVRGAGATDPNFTTITAALPLKRGDRLQHQLYDQIKSRLQAAAATYGYLDARMLRSELRVDTEQLRASAYLELETGERYRFGATTIKQNTITDSQIRRFLRYREGEPFDANQWLRTQFALDDSRYFSTVTVAPGNPDTVNHIVPIDIQAEPARRTYSFAVGYGADRSVSGSGGLRGSVGWVNPRVNTRGHRLQMQMQASDNQQKFDARYDVPFGDPALERVSLAFVLADTRVSDSVRAGEVSLTPSITEVLGRWQRVVSATATHTTTRDTNGRTVADLIVPGLTYASVPKNYLGESLLTRDLTIELLGSHTNLGAKAGFLRLHINANREFRLAPKWHLLLRAEAGATVVAATTDLPATYRFFAGGDVSVRGFSNGELSPVTLTTVQVTDAATGVTTSSITAERNGGRNILTGSVEIMRDLPKNTGIAAFIDTGNSLDRFGDPLAYSVGVGFRWRLPGVTMGIDVARALQAPSYGKRANDYFPLPGARIHLNIAQRL